MTPKEIFELETIGSHHWADTDAFWSFVYKEIDEELFISKDARGDNRVAALLKAASKEERFSQSYWAITFDSKLVGIITLWGRTEESWERYITNFPLYQAMLGYVRTMYTPIDNSEIVGEDEDVEDLEYQYGWIIDSNEPYNMRKEKK